MLEHKFHVPLCPIFVHLDHVFSMSRVTRSTAESQGGNSILPDPSSAVATNQAAVTPTVPAKGRGRGRGKKPVTPVDAAAEGSAPATPVNTPNDNTAEGPQRPAAAKDKKKPAPTKRGRKLPLTTAQEALLKVFMNPLCTVTFF
jgi:hypothetical protein